MPSDKKNNVNMIITVAISTIMGLIFILTISQSVFSSQRTNIYNSDNNSNIVLCNSGLTNFTFNCVSGSFVNFIDLRNKTDSIIIATSNYTVIDNNNVTLCLNDVKFNTTPLNFSYNCYDIDPNQSVATRTMISLIPIFFTVLVIVSIIIIFIKGIKFNK